MTAEDPQLDGNGTPTPNEKRESEETPEDLESLLEDDPQEIPKEGETPEERLERLEKNNARLVKGIQKIATTVGRQKVEKPEVKVQPTGAATPTPSDNDDLKVLFYNQTPVAEFVEDDLKTVADAKYGGSVLRAWNGESWLREKATSLSEAKKLEDEAKAKINTPSSQTGAGGAERDWAKLTVKEVDALPVSEYAKYSEWRKNGGVRDEDK